MIKLEANKMTKAIERAKTIRPRVRVVNADERTYAVTGSKGDTYTVKFAVASGHKLAECDCKAGKAGIMCYHIPCAASVNIAVQSMRKQAAEKVAAPRITRSIESDRTSVKYAVTRIDGWAI